MSTQRVPQPPLWRRFLSLPKTHLGWWSVGLSGVSVVLFLIALVVIAVYESPMSFPTWGVHWSSWGGLQKLTIAWSGLAGVGAGLIAVLVRRERSWLVWLAMVLGPAPHRLLYELNLDPYRYVFY
jgi:hypothetical protein